ncbi:MAG: ubiquinol-cytochrome C chaperone family protein [Pseudomonadota bacterium]|nr:ubiquinol-cytochrome C chaperone family protein [Pseudomonadota bacterium]
MFNFFIKKNNKKVSYKIYHSIVKQSRMPYFYKKYGVPDTPEGRFDLITIHAFLIFRRLKAETKETIDLGQEIFDLMFKDLEQNLREMGSGDLGVTKKIFAMAEALYGRIKVYEENLEDTQLLEEALDRNLFHNTNPKGEQKKLIANYIQQEAARLANVDKKDLLAGNIFFNSPEDILNK